LLADENMSVAVVTHEILFAGPVADRVVHFDEGQVVEESLPSALLRNPPEERIRGFLSR
jgi:ABC-type polar amino acid transport system ATPase subunit